MMAFSACSNDDDLAIPAGPSIEDDGTTFTISVSNTGVGTTRATRPMGSSVAANNVNKIKLVVYQKSAATSNNWQKVNLEDAPTEGTNIDVDFVPEIAANQDFAMAVISGSTGTPYDLADTDGVITYTDGLAESDSSNPTDQHISKTATVKVWGLQEDTEYRIVAYGYNEDATDNNNTTLTWTEQTNTSSNPTTLFTAKQELKQNQTVYDYEEVYADYATSATVTTEATIPDTDGGAGKTVKKVEFAQTPTLTLTRQVAGILAYLEHVAMNQINEKTGAYEVVEKIAVVANRKANNEFTIPNTLIPIVNQGNQDFNGGAITASGADNNGFNTYDEEELMYFIMKDCASSESYNKRNDDGAESELYDFEEGATAQGGYEAPAGFQQLAGTLFGARYLMPYDQHYDSQTLWLVLYTTKETDPSTATADKFTEIRRIRIKTNASNVNAYNYDIRCNNFYSIGVKMATDTEPEEGEDPDPEEDDPMDLTGKNIMVVVNDAWAVLHNMGVE